MSNDFRGWEEECQYPERERRDQIRLPQPDPLAIPRGTDLLKMRKRRGEVGSGFRGRRLDTALERRVGTRSGSDGIK